MIDWVFSCKDEISVLFLCVYGGVLEMLDIVSLFDD